MTACTMAETVTAAAVGAPTAATAGTTTSVTLATPAGTTAQQYRGMPIVLSGNVTETTGIMDYTAARVASLGSTLSTAAGATTNFQIPINVRYSPTSDEAVFKTATIGEVLTLTSIADLPTSPISGMLVNHAGVLKFYNGSTWKTISFD